MKLDNYECEGQLSLSDFLTPAQEYYFETGKTTYWQDSQQKPYHWWKNEEPRPVKIMGLMDDAYCPECDYCFWETKEMDCKRCPKCGIRVDWTPWHQANDEEEQNDCIT